MKTKNGGLCVLIIDCNIPKAGRVIKKIWINGKLAWNGRYNKVVNIGSAHQDSEYVYFTEIQLGEYQILVNYQGETPEYDDPVPNYLANFVTEDTLTKGNWEGIYGKDGYVLCNYNGEGRDERGDQQAVH